MGGAAPISWRPPPVSPSFPPVQFCCAAMSTQPPAKRPRLSKARKGPAAGVPPLDQLVDNPPRNAAPTCSRRPRLGDCISSSTTASRCSFSPAPPSLRHFSTTLELRDKEGGGGMDKLRL